jgi:hypothetical protein
MGTEPTEKLAVVLRGDAQLRALATPDSTRLAAVFTALTEVGLAAELVVYNDDWAMEVRDQLLGVDGVLVWADPVTTDGDRTVLDAVLREVAAAGVWLGAHPDIIAKMATKEVLYTTRNLGWGTDTHRYRTVEEFHDQFPARLAADGVRVLKPRRGNGGIGVWKVALIDDQPPAGVRPETPVCAQHALIRDETTEHLPLAEVMARCEQAFAADHGAGMLIDQAFCPRIDQGLIRCYMVKDRIVGFGRQYPKGLSPAERADAAPGSPAPAVDTIMGLPSPKTMYPADEPAFADLRKNIEGEWVPAMQQLLDIDTSALPALWDADLLYGSETPDGNDTYILCEINASSVIPFPADAPAALALATLAAIRTKISKTQQSASA